MTKQFSRAAGAIVGLSFALGFGSAARAGEAKASAQDAKGKPQWKALFDGKTLGGWKVAQFGGEGDVNVENGAIVMERGNDMTGLTYAGGDFPKMNYEVTLEGKKLKGFDFFCTTTFPVGDTHCSLVVGGWAGSVVGLSSIDGEDASRNATKTLHEFKKDQWYRVRIRVTQDRIQAWIDDKQVVNLATKGKKISIRAECDLCRPFGIATWNTVGAVRDIKVRTLTADEVKAKAKDGKEPEKKRKLGFTISKETTYIMEPLDKDGYIDYAAALNERLKKGVTPANNANVLLWQAIGPRPEGKPMPPELFQWMSVDPPPEKGKYFISLASYLTRQNLNQDDDETFDRTNQTSQRPWTAKQYPHLADWLKANERPLTVVVETTKRKGYFYPLIPEKIDQGPATLIGARLSGVQKFRELAHCLVTRSMLRVGEKRYDDAWQDLLALHRLGRLVARGGTLIEGLVGLAIENMASSADLALLDAATLDAKRIKTYLGDLQALPAIPAMVDKVDVAERFTFLDTVMKLDRDGRLTILEAFAGGKPPKADGPRVQRFLETIDWDPALRNGNRWYDRLVAAMREKNRGTREKQLSQIEDDLKKLTKKADVSGVWAKIILSLQKPAVQGERLGDVLISLMMPAVGKVQEVSERTEQMQRNLHVAFALAAYQREHGRYPKTLDALAPKYLAKIPDDLFSGKPLTYQPKDNGYLLYSIGPNGIDEGGRWYDDDPPGDDPRVRMPLPKLGKH